MATNSHPPTQPIILVVDDSKTVRRGVKRTLESSGYTVLEADDGSSGIRIIEERTDIALILCDVNMPGVDGIALLEHFRGSNVLSSRPVIMLTTEGRPDIIMRAQSLGAKGWLVKPYDENHLVHVVEHAISACAA